MNKQCQNNQENIAGSGYPQRGSILIYLVAVLVVAGALGAGIVSLTTTSTFSGLSYNPADRARYLAFSGIDYAVEEIKSGGNQLNFEEYSWPGYSLEDYEIKFMLDLDDPEEEIELEFLIKEPDESQPAVIEAIVKSTGRIIFSSLQNSKFTTMKNILPSDKKINIAYSHHDWDSDPPNPAANDPFTFRLFIRDADNEHIVDMPSNAFVFRCDGCSYDYPEILSIQEISSGPEGPHYLVEARIDSTDSIRIDVAIFNSGFISTTNDGFHTGSGYGVEVNY